MKDLWAVLARQRDYRLLLSAGLISFTGDWILRTGLAFQVYVLTGSTLASGGLLVASLLPNVLLGSLAGVFVDRWDRRRTMIVTNLLNAIVLLPLIGVRGESTLWIVYAVVLAQSCLKQFFSPAERSLVPSLVEPQQLVTANALNGQIRDIARLVGAGLGGVLAAVGGVALLAVADAVTFLLSMTLIAAIRHRTERRLEEHTTGTFRRLAAEWTEGIRICVTASALRLLFVLGVVTGIGEGVMGTLFAPFVKTELEGDSAVYGLIVSSQAVGGIIGGLVAASVGSRLSAAKMLGVGSVVFGLVDLALFCYPLVSDSLVPAFVCMIVVGLPGAFLMAGMTTLLQRLTKDSSRGRVFGAFGAVQGAAVLAGIMSAGVLGEVVGIIPVLVYQGLGYLVGGVVVLARRALLSTAPTAGASAVSVR